MEFRYRYNDADYAITLDPRPEGGYTARIGDRSHIVEVERRGNGELALTIDGKWVTACTAASRIGPAEIRYVVALVGRESAVFELARSEGAQHRRSLAAGAQGSLTAPMPGQVMEVFVGEGDAVTRGQPLLLLEAMKMEIRVSAPVDGVVARLLVRPRETVERGQELIEVRPPA